MGGGPSLPLAKGDSLVNPGKESIVSDPIEHDYDAFLDELITNLKYPVPFFLEAILKEVKVDEKGPDDFEVKVILDPVKLQGVGFHNKDAPNMPRIQIHNKVKLDREGRFIETVSYNGSWMGEASEPEVVLSARADFTKDPFRIDYYWTTPDGNRVADDMTLKVLQPLLNLCMSSLADRKVVVKLDSSKKVFTCEPIEEDITTYEPFFDGMIASLKAASNAGTLEEVADNKFKLMPAEPAMPHSTCTFDKEMGTVVMDLVSADGKKVSTSYYSVCKSPLTFEIYTDADGERLLGKSQMKLTQALIDATVYAATNSGWFSSFF